MTRILKISTALLSLTMAGSILSACTGQIPGSFRIKQAEESFDSGNMSSQDVNTKVDILWVIDNSRSMDISQLRLTNGVQGFIDTYIQPTWDIQMAVITTDIYKLSSINLANGMTERYSKIIRTIPPDGTPADAAWVQSIKDKATEALHPGDDGDGYERAYSSILKLLSANELNVSRPEKLFRAGSLRVIIMVGDEEDQTFLGTTTTTMRYWTNNFQSTGTPLAACQRTVDSYTYYLQTCVRDPLLPVSSIKLELDNFFKSLDVTAENTDPDPNYFVVSIVPPTGTKVQQLHNERGEDYRYAAPDRPDRLIELGTLVGNGSSVIDITENDYTPGLTALGDTVVSKKASFTLARAPTGGEEILFLIKHIDGSSTVVPPSKYTLSGKVVTITDHSLILSLASTDKIVITYQPTSVY